MMSEKDIKSLVDHVAALKVGEEWSSNQDIRILADWISSGKVTKILVLSGAGVSVAAGIPDFRTPGTGLYSNLKKYSLPYPEAVFDVGFFRSNPQPFVTLAKELWPGLHHSPTMTHSFLKLLSNKGLLLRNYSQNIDGLEHLAGIPEEELVECHGHFRSSSCIECGAQADPDRVKNTIATEGSVPKCEDCGGNVKPDIVFFGESLVRHACYNSNVALSRWFSNYPQPERFHKLLRKDVKEADLLLIMGTSLQVAPVSLIPNMVSCSRVLFNREKVLKIRKKDMFLEGNCDDSVTKLCATLGWKEELLELYRGCRLSGEAEQKTS